MQKTKKKIFLLNCLLLSLVLVVACSGNKKALRVGDTLPLFSATALDGKQFSLHSHKGSPVIVRFFLLDCPYCKADTPVFNKFYADYKKAGLAMVYINNNGSNKHAVEKFAAELGIKFPVVYDPSAKLAKQYNIKVQPLTMVLSPEHKLLAALLGGVSEAELQELLGKYLQG
jgi:peroxiredoxin